METAYDPTACTFFPNSRECHYSYDNSQLLLLKAWIRQPEQDTMTDGGPNRSRKNFNLKPLRTTQALSMFVSNVWPVHSTLGAHALSL